MIRDGEHKGMKCGIQDHPDSPRLCIFHAGNSAHPALGLWTVEAERYGWKIIEPNVSMSVDLCDEDTEIMSKKVGVELTPRRATNIWNAWLADRPEVSDVRPEEEEDAGTTR